MFSLAVALFALTPFALAAPHDHSDHRRLAGASLPDTWFHKEDHPVHSLFRRGTDGGNYPDVGSPEWAAKYPVGVPDVSQLPKEWTDALAAAIAAGKIPDIPATDASSGTPMYPTGLNAESPEICSSTAKCRIEGDIWDAPDGVFALNFDDGPRAASPMLTDFLVQNNKIATHFIIGSYLAENPEEFKGIYNSNADLAVHTYTHPYMTSQTNEEVLAQIGWTMQILHDSTGGRVPKYWRPPYGDSDMRVRAITREVFGLEVIMWNLDSDDWALTTGGQTVERIQEEMVEWLTGPKSPGLIILEHELSDQSVQAFINAYPLIEQNGWNIMSVARCFGSDSAYKNADSSNSDTVTPAGILLSEQPASSPETPSQPSESSDSSSSTSSSSSSSSSPSPSSGSSTSDTQSDASTDDNSAPSMLSSPLSSIFLFAALALLL